MFKYWNCWKSIVWLHVYLSSPKVDLSHELYTASYRDQSNINNFVLIYELVMEPKGKFMFQRPQSILGLIGSCMKYWTRNMLLVFNRSIFSMFSDGSTLNVPRFYHSHPQPLHVIHSFHKLTYPLCVIQCNAPCNSFKLTDRITLKQVKDESHIAQIRSAASNTKAIARAFRKQVHF